MVSGSPADLIDLSQAQRHLRLPVGVSSPMTNGELDVQEKLDQATALIVQYLERPDDTAWTAEMAAWTVQNVPGPVAAAILIQLAELYRFRGDDGEGPKREAGYLAPTVVALLKRYRDPIAR